MIWKRPSPEYPSTLPLCSCRVTSLVHYYIVSLMQGKSKVPSPLTFPTRWHHFPSHRTPVSSNHKSFRSPLSSWARPAPHPCTDHSQGIRLRVRACALYLKIKWASRMRDLHPQHCHGNTKLTYCRHSPMVNTNRECKVHPHQFHLLLRLTRPPTVQLTCRG